MPTKRSAKDVAARGASVSNGQVAAMLLELADALEVGGTDAFRVRAYRSAARVIENLGPPVAEIAAEGGVKALRELPSVGESMAKKILEITETGSLAALEEARETIPRELTDLLALEGLGPKKLHVLHRELGIRNLDDLEAAIKAGRLAELAGFGRKTEEKLTVAIEHFRRRLGRFRRADLDLLAGALERHLTAQPRVERVAIAGSFRRARDTIGDLDILCVAADPGPVMDAFAAFPVMTAAIGRVAKMRTDPCDMIRLWRSAFSARSPSTRASTRGASG